MSKIPHALVALLLAGCQSTEGETMVADAAKSEAPPSVAMARPAARTLTLEIEGTRETVPARLFDAPATFPLSFSTYIPDDMQTSVDPTTDTVRIVAAFGGRLRNEARMDVVALPAAVDVPAARKLAGDVARSLGGARRPNRYEWSDIEFVLEGALTGSLVLAAHEGLWFYLLVRYPPEFGDGMAARVAMILDQWRWGRTDSQRERRLRLAPE